MRVFSLVIFVSFLAALPMSFAAENGMANMPKIQPKRIVTVKTKDEGEALQEDRGFGEKDAEVSMMNLMMVEGSGYEGMDMNAGMKMDSSKGSAHDMHGMKMAANDASKTSVGSTNGGDSGKRYSLVRKNASEQGKVGSNLVEFTVTDTKTEKLAKGLNIKVEVSMTSMDMGTTNPKVREVSPGTYQVKAAFSMKGPWAVKLILPGGQEEILPFTAGSAQ